MCMYAYIYILISTKINLENLANIINFKFLSSHS